MPASWCALFSSPLQPPLCADADSCILPFPSKPCIMAIGQLAETRHVVRTFQELLGMGCECACWLLQTEGKKTVPLEVQKDIIHNKRGILSMGRHSDPNSGGSSFSILLGPAPHLDQEYSIFGCAQTHLARHWQGWS